MWQESRLGGKTCSVKLSQNVATKVMRRHRKIVYLAFHGFCRGRVLLVFFFQTSKAQTSHIAKYYNPKLNLRNLALEAHPQ